MAAAGALAIAVLVGLAAAGDLPTGDARRPSDGMLDLLLSFGVVLLAGALLAGAVLFVLGWSLKLRGGGSGEAPSPLRGFVAIAFAVVVLGAFALLRRRRDETTPLEGADELGRPGEVAEPAPLSNGYEPEFTTVPVLVFLGAVAAGLLALWLTHRARRRQEAPRLRPPAGPSLDALLAGTVDDLRTEPDPRRAVIAAYARLEASLAAAGHPRSRADAPGEYLGRVLREAAVSPQAATRLTALFAQAKFSQHAVGEEMRADAISALERVRNDLRDREALREALVPA